MSKWQKMKTADLEKFLSGLTEKWELWVPYQSNGKWEFGRYDPGKKVVLPGSIIHVSLKELLFPKRRPIATFDDSSKWSLEPVEPPEKPKQSGLQSFAGIQNIQPVLFFYTW